MDRSVSLDNTADGEQPFSRRRDPPYDAYPPMVVPIAAALQRVIRVRLVFVPDTKA
jgi:hypothetical protein